MKSGFAIAGIALACMFAGPAHSTAYNFSVTYSGSGSATLDAGSDNPIGTTLNAGDSFLWTIRAVGTSFWDVLSGGGFFPLMAFGVNEAANRTGSFDLALRNDGSDVFTVSEVGSLQSEVHMGTNTVTLATGLKFDEMFLSYTLGQALDTITMQPVGSTPNGLLPIFGAPEQNPYYPGIAYVNGVPEPETYALMLAGLGLTAWVARRRRPERS